MILLTSTSDLIRVVTGQAVDVSVHASYVDYNSTTSTATLGRQNTLISTATTTTVLASPNTNFSRNLKHLSVTNNHTSSSVDITIQHTDGTTVSSLWNQPLTAGETITYSDDEGFFNEGVSDTTSWYENLYWAFGRCDPQQGLRMAQMSGAVAPTPTNIGTTVARIAYFRPPANIIVNRIRYCGIGAVTAGVLPDPAATIAAQAAWTGGFPLLFLDNNDS